MVFFFGSVMLIFCIFASVWSLILGNLPAGTLIATPDAQIKGLNPHRTRVGVGEIVHITLPVSVSKMSSTPVWSFKPGSYGTLKNMNASSITFIAADLPGSTTIQARAGGIEYSVTLTVVAPSGVRVRPLQGDNGPATLHKQETNGTGMALYTYLMPDDVSFSRLYVSEVNAQINATGALSVYDGAWHCGDEVYKYRSQQASQPKVCGSIPVSAEITPGFGSRLDGVDCAYFQPLGPTPPQGAEGYASVLIYHQYSVGEQGAAHPFGKPSEQSMTLTKKRELIVHKDNALVETMVAGPDNGFSCIHEDGSPKSCGAFKQRPVKCSGVALAAPLSPSHQYHLVLRSLNPPSGTPTPY